MNTYNKFSKIGFVTGAGVTADSGIRTYERLVLRLLELTSQKELLNEPTNWVLPFVKEQLSLLEEKDKKTVPPDEIVLFIKNNLKDKNYSIQDLLSEALYENVEVKKTVGRKAFEENTTLNAIISFCAAKPDSIVAPIIRQDIKNVVEEDRKKNKEEQKGKKDTIEINTKVGGILTTNYDNLIEGAFHTKYRIKRLIPIGRPRSSEDFKDTSVIPVYHNHGYVHYLRKENRNMEIKNPSIVISEDDYFNRFYDSLGFGNYTSMNFLRRFPCLFIGSALTDKNIRRYLYHLIQDCGKTGDHQRKFAILRISDASQPQFVDKVLLTYGVETLWIEEFDEIHDILRDLYTSVDGIDQNDWDYVKKYK